MGDRGALAERHPLWLRPGERGLADMLALQAERHGCPDLLGLERPVVWRPSDNLGETATRRTK